MTHDTDVRPADESHATVLIDPRPYRNALIAVIAIGFLIQVLLGCRSWIGGDQVTLLRLGQDFATSWELRPVAKTMSGGGAIPGSLLQILIGLPLTVWQDYHAPLISIAILDLIAVLLIARVAGAALDVRFALCLVTLYWLSPWRTYHSGFIWEPAFIFFPAALHFWSSWKLRERGSFVPSLFLVASLLWAFQLHGSFLVLVLITLVLLMRRRLRLHAGGVLAGLIVGGATLIPTIMAYMRGTLPSSLPSEGFIGYGLVKVGPLLKGILYWFRVGSLDIGDPLKQTVFLNSEWAASHEMGSAARIGVYILWGLLIVTIGLSGWASWWYLRKSPAERGGTSPSRIWLRGYAGAAFIALVVSAALAPFTLQGWHVIVALHAALLPGAVWSYLHWEKVRGPLLPIAAAVVAIQIITIAVIGFGNNIFRFDVTPHELGERNNLDVLRPILPSELPPSR